MRVVNRNPDMLPGTVNDPYINSSFGSTQRGPIRCGRLVGGLDWNGGLERWKRMNARSRGRL